MTDPAKYLNLDGIPSTAPHGNGLPHFWQDPQGAWRLNEGDRSFDVEAVCLQLHEGFRTAIMQGVDYSGLLRVLPAFVFEAGLNSEAPVSSSQFQELLKRVATFPELNRFLYLYDCQRLVSSIQECAKEVMQILGEFYLTLNTEPFFGFGGHAVKPNETRWSSSPTTTKLTAFLNFIFIRLHSLLDYSVKVGTEGQRLRTDFTRYPKMASSNAQFGDRKSLSFNGRAGTLFEHCQFVTSLEILRNHLIHDALLDEMPKGYERFENGVVVERFLLFPDMTAGRLDRYVNRNLFFGGEDKINLRLPALVTEFQLRLQKTLEAVVDILQKRYAPTVPAAAP